MEGEWYIILKNKDFTKITELKADIQDIKAYIQYKERYLPFSNFLSVAYR